MNPDQRRRATKLFLRRKGEVKTWEKYYRDIKLKETAKQVSPQEAVQIRTAIERVLMEDPRSLVFLIGGASRTYKGQQHSFYDIDLAVVTSKGSVFNKLSDRQSKRKFEEELRKIVGRKVDVLAFKRQNFRKPANIIRELAQEKKQQLFPIHSLVHGIPFYNIERAKNFQEHLGRYLKMAEEEEEIQETERTLIKRSLLSRLLRKQ